MKEDINGKKDLALRLTGWKLFEGTIAMRVVEELDELTRNELRKNHQGHHLFKTHIKVVLDASHCFKVDISARDFEKIMIYAYFPISGNGGYHRLSDVVRYLIDNPNFLSNPTVPVFLTCQTVLEYFDKLAQCSTKPQDCFIGLGHCFMLDKNETQNVMHNEITDGMHRLVAYGLASKLNEAYFPISVYLGTNKTKQIIETT